MSSISRSSLNIGCWNINGLKDKHRDKCLINCIKSYDILCLQEAKCIDTSQIVMPDYFTFLVKRPKEANFPLSGGMLLFIKKALKSKISILENKCSEIQWLKLSKENFAFESNIYICFTYLAPSCSSYVLRHNLDILPQLEKDIEYYSNLGDILIKGDMNARIGTETNQIDNNNKYINIPHYVSHNKISRQSYDNKSNARGKELLDMCISSNLSILNGQTFGDYLGKFTCFQYNGNSVVDYCLVSDNLVHNILYFHVHDHNPLLSDHARISTKLYASFMEETDDSDSIQCPIKYSWKSESPLLFTKALESDSIQEKINNFINYYGSNKNTMDSKDINNLVDNFNDIVHSACEKSIKRAKPNKSKKESRKKKWVDADISKMHNQLKMKSLAYSKHPNDPYIRGNFYKFRKFYSKCCKKKKRQFREKILAQLESMSENDPNQYWALINELKECDSDTTDPATNISPGKWKDYFSELFSPKKKFEEIDKKFQSLLSEREQNGTFTYLDFTIEQREIKDAISKLKNKKAVGLDNISNEMMKTGLHVLMPCIHKMFNVILSSGKYPDQWKTGYIKPLHKGDSPNDPSNYRGISIMPCLSKIFNSILNNRLQNFFDSNKTINQSQIGFQPKARTSDHMFILRTLIEKYLSNGSKLYACFVDYSKAFDSVMHSALFCKLTECGISGPFYKIIKSMYANNKIHVRVGNTLSHDFTPNIGLRQGDNLSPNLFKLYINDLASSFQDEDDPVMLGNIPINCLLYADDVVLLSSSEVGLQNCLNKLYRFSESIGLSVNLKKTNILTFSKGGRKSKYTFTYNNIKIKHVSSYKYLGILFSSSGSFTECKKDLYNRSLKANFKLNKTFNTINPNVNTLLNLFDHTVKPVLLYASEIWGTINTETKKVNQDEFCLFKHLENLPCEKLHVRYLKHVLGVHRKSCNDAVMGDLGRFPLYFDCITSCIKYYTRLTQTPVSELLNSARLESEKLYKSNKNSWMSNVFFFLKYLNIHKSQYNDKQLHTVVRKQLISKFKLHFMKKMDSTIALEGKLRTYALYKKNFCREPYLATLKNSEARKCLTKIRTSSHKLQIEVGRYKKIEANKRVCEECNSNKIEDEVHFLTSCNAFTSQRNTLYEKVKMANANFIGMSNINKFVWLMSNEDEEIIKALADFVFTCYNLRTNVLNTPKS